MKLEDFFSIREKYFRFLDWTFRLNYKIQIGFFPCFLFVCLFWVVCLGFFFNISISVTWNLLAKNKIHLVLEKAFKNH